MINKLINNVQYMSLWLFYFSRFSMRRFYQQRGLQIASSLAYATLLALVPLVTVMFGFLGGLSVFEDMGDSIQVVEEAENRLVDVANQALGDGNTDQRRGEALRDRLQRVDALGAPALEVLLEHELAAADDQQRVLAGVISSAEAFDEPCKMIRVQSLLVRCCGRPLRRGGARLAGRALGRRGALPRRPWRRSQTHDTSTTGC